MDWYRFYDRLESNPELLREPAHVCLIEQRLREIRATQEQLLREAQRCDELLDTADLPLN